MPHHPNTPLNALPFARRVDDGQLVSPREVERGAACRCICPECSASVVAKKGTEKRWHFAHVAGAGCGLTAGAALHQVACQVAASIQQLVLPDVLCSVSVVDAARRLHSAVATIAERAEVFVEVGEFPGESVKPDLYLATPAGAILVEIVVVHRVSDDKLARLKEHNLPVLEINLHHLASAYQERSGVLEEISTSAKNRRWLFHPEIVRMEEDLAGEIRARPEFVHTYRDLPHVTAGTPRHDGGCGIKWRASLPTKGESMAAAEPLCAISGFSLDVLSELLQEIPTRSALQKWLPTDLVDHWAQRLGIPVKDVEQYLVDAQFAHFE
jgi:hypothetical protein